MNAEGCRAGECVAAVWGAGVCQDGRECSHPFRKFIFESVGTG